MADRENEPEQVIEATLRVPGARIEVARFVLAGPVDNENVTGDSYRLNLCLTPRPLDTRAGFPDRWGPHRFEPIGETFLLPPGHRMHMRGEGGRQTAVICTLERQLVDRWLDGEIDWTDRRLEASLDLASPIIRGLMGRLAEEAHRPGLGSPLLAELLAGQLAIEVARFCATIQDGPVTGGLAAWRLRTIDTRLRDLHATPTLEELAALCNLSVRQLTRGFRTSRGCSISDHIAHARIEGAKRLLAGEDSVKSIAFAMGYSSPSSFAYAFRRAIGITPRDFRQRTTRPRS